VHVLSVDLGTSNTVAALAINGQPPRVVEVDGSATMPSALFADEDGTLLVGRDAERRARLNPARYEPNPKRRIDEGSLLLGDAVVPVTEALAAVLRRVLAETGRQLGGRRPNQLRLTHPARWGRVRRGVLLGAAHRVLGSGHDLLSIPEPVAAAAHFASFPGRSLRPGQALAVYDLGAGTFDCAIVAATGTGFVVLAEAGLPDLGGLDVDFALTEHVGRQVGGADPVRWQRLLQPQTTVERRAALALRDEVRAAKEALSRHPQAEVPMPEPFRDALVTREELEALVRPSLLRSVELLGATIRSAGMTAQSLAGIYLVGGSSRIPLIARLIAERLGVLPTSLDQPETAVALGAHHVPAGGAQPALPPPAQRLPSAPAFPALQVFSRPAPGAQSLPAAVATGRRSRTAVVAALVVAVVAVVVVAAVLAFGRSSQLPTAADCATPGSTDGAGFTRCLRQLAGAVPENHTCRPGGSGEPPVQQFGGLTVSCDLGGGQPHYRVSYTHGAPELHPDQVLSAAAGAPTANRVEAQWAGNGLDGRYVSTVDSGRGVLVFAVRDRPLFGVLAADKADGLTPDALADYFERNIQPGT
jgi:hypothetical protein